MHPKNIHFGDAVCNPGSVTMLRERPPESGLHLKCVIIRPCLEKETK